MNIIELAKENCPYHSEEMRGAYYDGFVRAAALVRAEALAEPELNLNCKSVQARLATVWGYVKAEQAEQKPVAWALTSENGEVLDCISHTYKVTQPCTVDYDEPLYAAPVRTKDLTDDEIAKIAFVDKVPLSTKSLARAAIAAYKEKNK